jgi:hypothetical protein
MVKTMMAKKKKKKKKKKIDLFEKKKLLQWGILFRLILYC